MSQGGETRLGFQVFSPQDTFLQTSSCLNGVAKAEAVPWQAGDEPSIEQNSYKAIFLIA